MCNGRGPARILVHHTFIFFFPENGCTYEMIKVFTEEDIKEFNGPRGLRGRFVLRKIISKYAHSMHDDIDVDAVQLDSTPLIRMRTKVMWLYSRNVHQNQYQLFHPLMIMIIQPHSYYTRNIHVGRPQPLKVCFCIAEGFSK